MTTKKSPIPNSFWKFKSCFAQTRGLTTTKVETVNFYENIKYTCSIEIIDDKTSIHII